MSWNDDDPWNKKPKKDESEKKKDDDNLDGLPDIDEMIKNFLKKFDFLGNGNGNGNQSFNKKTSSVSLMKFIPAIIGILVILWGISGFYTIQEAERGVILRLGKKQDALVQPGLNWKLTFIDKVQPINVRNINIIKTDGDMLTQDENLVKVEMSVNYRISEPQKFLFKVKDPADTLAQATDSALRYVVGHMKMDDILTRERTEVKNKTWELLNNIIAPYDMGLEILDVNFQSARSPEEVKEAFDDAIRAQEDEQRLIKEAEVYSNKELPIAKGQAQRIREEAIGYKEKVVLDAKGEIARFSQLLPAYKENPKLLKNRLYIESMEKIMSKTPKVIMDGNNSINVLPLEKMLNENSIGDKK